MFSINLRNKDNKMYKIIILILMILNINFVILFSRFSYKQYIYHFSYYCQKQTKTRHNN